ncbi:helix-turn-helix domain-containing protein [Microtetraspora niveoalba]|uniref:helix-turn-helix domain-containing protein n=1 Tax=Microtetraspora niveoalba TaxID=46175 RepID=UPI00082B481C|nr:helix-turn-helix transcriptional regulator [Microtetraspora niveoalba]
MAQLTKVDGRKIRSVREAREMSADELADAVSCHPDHLRNIELGHKQPSMKLFGAIYRALDVERAELLADEQPATVVAGR